MTDSRKIVVPVDFSPHSQAAAVRACELARASGSSIHLVHAVRPPVVMAHEFAFPADYWNILREAASKEMSALQDSLAKEGVELTADLVNMEAVGAICVASNEEDVDLIVMGTHGYTGWKHAFLGSVTERTLRSVSTPVMAVKLGDSLPENGSIRNILVATDFSSHSRVAAREAAKWAKHLDAEIELVHVVPEPASLLAAYSVPGGPELLHEIRDAASGQLEDFHASIEALGAKVSSRLLGGDAPTAIAKRAEEIGAQLVALGTRGNTGLKHVFLGSVAERTLRLSPCSVLVACDSVAGEAGS